MDSRWVPWALEAVLGLHVTREERALGPALVRLPLARSWASMARFPWFCMVFRGIFIHFDTAFMVFY